MKRMLIPALIILALVIAVAFFFPKFMYERGAGKPTPTPIEAYSKKCFGFEKTYQKGDGGVVKHYCLGILFAGETQTTEEEAIGEIVMNEDSSLTVNLYVDGGGQMQTVYAVGDKDYGMWLTHVGGLVKGEKKLVPPFPY
jgi:hypothetical protein